MRRKKQIEVLDIREVKSAVIDIKVDDKTFNALAEAGRIHLQKDKKSLLCNGGRRLSRGCAIWDFCNH